MAKVLYFIEGPTPTAEERELAAALGTTKFRNAHLASGNPEACHAVAGAVPPSYAHLPRADITSEPAPASEPADDFETKPRGRRKP